MRRDNIERIKGGIDFLFEKTNIEITYEISLVNQYNDVDDYQILQTSRELPLYKLSDESRFNEWKNIFNLGDRDKIYSRVFGGYREFISLIEKEAPYSYSFAILHIPISEYGKIGYCDHNQENVQWSEEFKFPTFLDYLIESFFYCYRDRSNIPYGDIIRRAGERFFCEILFSESSLNLNICNDINILSALKYEGSENKGNLLLCKSIDNIIGLLDVRFVSPISINSYRKIRKLLEIAKDDVYLIGTPRQVYGFITSDVIRRIKYTEVYQIKIGGSINWELLKLNTFTLEAIPIIQCRNSIYQYAKPDFNFDKFYCVIAERFPNANVHDLSPIIESAMRQHHGTTIVFSENAEEEAKRLKTSSFIIEPIYSPKMIKYLTSIDGAILFDVSGKCHAIGVILDGLTSETEDISNGARHNSARRYKMINPNCVVIVISEDGYITPIY